MKRFLTVFFVALSVLALIISFRFDVRWNGIIAWGLAFIFLIMATYFTKYIPNKDSTPDDEHEE